MVTAVSIGSTAATNAESPTLSGDEASACAIRPRCAGSPAGAPPDDRRPIESLRPRAKRLSDAGRTAIELRARSARATARIHSLRHGLGRSVDPPAARLLIEACTFAVRKSSADLSISASAAKASLTRRRICCAHSAGRSTASTASTMRRWADRPVCLAREPNRARHVGGRRRVEVRRVKNHANTTVYASEKISETQINRPTH
jgi:hypothetical protein